MTEWARYWRSSDGTVEVMAAHFEQHVYHRHSHETYSFGVTDEGVQAFRCRGEQRAGVPGTALVFNPDDPHDGHAGDGPGFTYRIIHVAPEVVESIMADASGMLDHGLPLFREPVVTDQAVRLAVERVYDRLAHADAKLACDEAMADLVLTAAERLTGWMHAPESGSHARKMADEIREILESDRSAELGAADLASAVGRSRFAIRRAFRSAFDMSPSDYQRQVRLRHARSQLARGLQIADVAAEVGFADQAHLTRWFKRYYGITPGDFRAQGPAGARSAGPSTVGSILHLQR